MGLSIWLAKRLKSFTGKEAFPIASGGNNDGTNDFSVNFEDFKAYCQGVTGANNVYTLVQNSVTGNPATLYVTIPNPSLATPIGNEIFLFTPTISNAINPQLTINFNTPNTANLTKDSNTGLTNLVLNDLVVGTTYAIIKESVTNTYQVIGKNTGGVSTQPDWLQTNSLLSDFIRNKSSIVDANAASNNSDTDPDLTTDLQSLIYNFTNYLNRIRVKTNGLTFNKIRKISGQFYQFPRSSEIFGSVLGSSKQNTSTNSNQSINIELSARVREWVPFSELSSMTSVSNYFTTTYGGIVGQKSFDDTNNIVYQCYTPNRWVITSGGRSGDGNPTSSNLSNCSTFGSGSEQWFEKDGRVFVKGIFTLTITSTGDFAIYITVPISPIVTGQGVVSGQGVSGVAVAVSSTQIIIQATSTGSGIRLIAYSYSYKKS